MDGDDTVRVQWRVRISDDQPSGVFVRRQLRSVLSDLSEATVLDALLLVDALVSESLRFRHVPEELRMSRTDGCLRIDVVFCAATSEMPSVFAPSTGHGRLLLESLATNWSVTQEGRKSVAWAELDLI